MVDIIYVLKVCDTVNIEREMRIIKFLRESSINCFLFFNIKIQRTFNIFLILNQIPKMFLKMQG